VTTIAEPRSTPRTTALDRLLAVRLRLSWDAALIFLIFLAALALRFYDLGGRAIHHDESLHATFAWYFYRGMGYAHDPLMHGPFLFHAMALAYGLFGISDATARFVPAIFGALLVLLPWLLRDRLGRTGTVVAGLLLAVSPTLIYFSRFVGAGAQDIVLAVTVLLIAAAIWRYLDDGRSRWLYLTAGALSVSFATKEVTFIIALVFILWLDGLMAADLAAQRETRPLRRLVWTVALFPIAWLLACLWPALERPRARLRLTHLPRAADVLLILGLFTAPQFAAAVQVPLERVGYDLADASRIPGLTNEQLFGGAAVGLLLAATLGAGLAWRRRDFLFCAAIFWGIYAVLFTTFFTNMQGFATGIWGSLDYWLDQQGEERGKQPVFYYAVMTPVYEYLALLLALWGVAWAAIRGGLSTALALAACLGFVVLGIIFGRGDVHGAPFAALALLTLAFALRRDLFRSFLAFWAAAVFFGLSVAGEKMPWLEVHIALPLALLAALAVNDLVTAAWRGFAPSGDGSVRAIPWRSPTVLLVLGAALAAGIAALGLLWPGDTGDRAPLILAALALAAVCCVVALVRTRAAGALAIGVLIVALLLPLTVRDGIRAAFIHSDTPHDMLIYTQTSPQLKEMMGRIDELARVTGQGKNLPITIDTADAFTWPWAWYLRDYKDVMYLDLSGYPLADLPKTRPGAVLITQSANASAADAWPGAYGRGERFPHRWWFPEEAYRDTTGPRLWRWLRDPEQWGDWLQFFLHRTTPYSIGSVDAVAFFPPDFAPSSPGAAPATYQPRQESDRLIIGGPGSTPGAFSRPAAVAIDPSGDVLVADSLNHRIQKFSADGERRAVSDPSLGLLEPWGVAADAAGNVYVADTWNHRIVKLNSDLTLIDAWGDPAAAGRSAEPSPLELYGPRAIVVDADGNLWVTDTGNARVIKLSSSGEPLGVYGVRGAGPREFQEPVGIALGPNGELLVADTWNGRVQRFSRDFEYVGEFQVAGWEDLGQENKPYLAVLSEGSVLVSVPDYGQIERIGADGRGRTTWDRFGDGGDAVRPVGVAVDPQGRIWVTDAAGSRLLRLPSP